LRMKKALKLLIVGGVVGAAVVAVKSHEKPKHTGNKNRESGTNHESVENGKQRETKEK